MATPADFMVDVRLRAPGVPEPYAELAIMQAAIQFCEDTNIFSLPHRANAVAGQPYFDIVVADAVNTEVHQCRKVWYKTNPNPLSHIATSGVNTPFAYYNTVNGVAAPQADPQVWYEHPDSDERIGVFYPPQETLTNAFTALVALKPPRTSSDVPTILYKNWYWAIVWGALKKLKETPNQPWSLNAEQASTEYARLALDAKVAADRGMSPGNMTVAMTPFAWGRR